MIASPSITQTRAYSCLDCGKCTAVCPVSRYDENFSPRLLVYARVSGQDEGAGPDHRLTQCLTCGLCSRRCPSAVDYLGFARLSREEERQQRGSDYPCAHGGALQSLQRLQSRAGDHQRHLDWVPEGAPVVAEGELLYFSGCLPFFDAYFTHLAIDSTEIARSSLRLLAAAGETPAVLATERCCGHDLYWSGDRATATALAIRNAEAIRASGAKRVVTSCPECASMLRDVYPTLGADLDAEVLHLSEYLSEKLETGELKLKRLDGAASFHDSCRLGRQLKAGGAARQLLAALYGEDYKELAKHGEEAPCCGTSGWLHCDAVSRQLQTDRLQEVVAVGAGTLVTACPKCRLHFRCTQAGNGDESTQDLEIRDLAMVAAEAIDGGEITW